MYAVHILPPALQQECLPRQCDEVPVGNGTVEKKRKGPPARSTEGRFLNLKERFEKKRVKHQDEAVSASVPQQCVPCSS